MSTDPLSKQRQSLLLQLLKAIHTSQGDRQIIYPLLHQNQHLLDRQFAQQLTLWATDKGETSPPQTIADLGHVLCRFAELIASCPEGNHRIYCEIAIASYQVALHLFSQTSNTSDRAQTKTLLTELENHYQTLPDSVSSSAFSAQNFPNSRDGLYLSRRVEERSYELLQWGGYGLLLLSLLQSIELAIATDFSSFLGRLDFAHGLINIVWMPLIGLILVFYRQEGYVSRPHLSWLRLLSWVSLALAGLYAMLSILGLNASMKIAATTPQPQTINSIARNAIASPNTTVFAQPIGTSPSLPLRRNRPPLGLLGGIWGAFSFAIVWRMTRWTRAFRG